MKKPETRMVLVEIEVLDDKHCSVGCGSLGFPDGLCRRAWTNLSKHYYCEKLKTEKDGRFKRKKECIQAEKAAKPNPAARKAGKKR